MLKELYDTILSATNLYINIFLLVGGIVASQLLVLYGFICIFYPNYFDFSLFFLGIATSTLMIVLGFCALFL